MNDPDRHILELAAQIVTAQVRHNAVKTVAIPGLIQNVYNALIDVGRTVATGRHDHTPSDDLNQNGHRHPHAQPKRHASNVYVHPTFGQTVFDDHLICMEDGLSMKMLKRHLQTVHDMTPDEYRAKWGLPDDYPMVAATYARLRSSLAVESGLGLKPEARAGRKKKSR